MILMELKQYIADQGVATRAQLAKQFSMSEDGVDAMLNLWVKKGKISRLIDTNKAQHITRVRYRLNQTDQLSMTVTM
ncbi:iron transporter FeoC [Vibrio sp. 10N.286.49.B3]|uniref:FeoC-like transcriptional regulator n=1 Tax=Vibrio sp. 10N.286.49.B3 TaxID=1880855 RepID=UPI000C85A36E|nr:FeoC-like transcriptional regulator [Vibrio sp. 10N.286.49.B3]PMH41901.1 iron transporter FeoC [Vibrio sp. 10N.286.49.B3]